MHVGWEGGSALASLWRNSCTAALWGCPWGPSRGWFGLHGCQPKGAQQLQRWPSCSRQETARRGAEGSGRLRSSSCKRRVAGDGDSTRDHGKRKRRRSLRLWMTSPEKRGQVRKSTNGYGIEKTSTPRRRERRGLPLVVVVDAGTRRFGHKSSPESSSEFKVLKLWLYI